MYNYILSHDIYFNRSGVYIYIYIVQRDNAELSSNFVKF